MACSHIYPGFTGKVSSLTHFPLEPGCEDYSFLDKAVTDFEQGLHSFFTDSLEPPELDTSLDEPDAIISSVSSGFLCSVSTLSDNSKLQLAPSIGYHKLLCQARALLAPVPLATKMLASKLILYLSRHLCLILREVLSLCLKCMIYFSRFTTFWTWLFPNELGTLLVF